MQGQQQWNDPRFIITLLLIILFGIAYASDTSDQAMKGAIIGAFSAAYGFWIGSKQSEQATENTGKAFEAIKAAQNSMPTDQPIDAKLVQEDDDPSLRVVESPPQSAPDARSEPLRAPEVPDSQISGSGAGEAPRPLSDDQPKDPTWQ